MKKLKKCKKVGTEKPSKETRWVSTILVNYSAKIIIK